MIRNRLTRLLSEDLNQAKVEDESSPAAQAARKLGLLYVGFGRYENTKTGQISHIVQQGKLVPFNRATKTSSFRTNNADDMGTLSQIMGPSNDELDKALSDHYSPSKYDNREIDAIRYFVDQGYSDINKRLASVPAGTSAKYLEPLSADDRLGDVISSLDSALKKSRAPGEFVVYTKLGPGYNLLDFNQGDTFQSKGYLVATLRLDSIMQELDPEKTTSRTGRPIVPIMQVHVKKNAKGLYASNFSENSAGEFIIPRGTKFTVVSGSRKLVGSDALSNNLSLEIQYIDCMYK